MAAALSIPLDGSADTVLKVEPDLAGGGLQAAVQQAHFRVWNVRSICTYPRRLLTALILRGFVRHNAVLRVVNGVSRRLSMRAKHDYPNPVIVSSAMNQEAAAL